MAKLRLRKVEVPIDEVAAKGTQASTLLHRADEAGKKRGIPPNDLTSLEELDRYLESGTFLAYWTGRDKKLVEEVRQAIETKAKEKLASAKFHETLREAQRQLESVGRAIRFLEPRLVAPGAFGSRREYSLWHRDLTDATTHFGLTLHHAQKAAFAVEKALEAGTKIDERSVAAVAELDESLDVLRRASATIQRATELLDGVQAPAPADPPAGLIATTLTAAESALRSAFRELELADGEPYTPSARAEQADEVDRAVLHAEGFLKDAQAKRVEALDYRLDAAEQDRVRALELRISLLLRAMSDLERKATDWRNDPSR